MNYHVQILFYKVCLKSKQILFGYLHKVYIIFALVFILDSKLPQVKGFWLAGWLGVYVSLSVAFKILSFTRDPAAEKWKIHVYTNISLLNKLCRCYLQHWGFEDDLLKTTYDLSNCVLWGISIAPLWPTIIKCLHLKNKKTTTEKKWRVLMLAN